MGLFPSRYGTKTGHVGWERREVGYGSDRIGTETLVLYGIDDTDTSRGVGGHEHERARTWQLLNIYFRTFSYKNGIY